MKEFDYVIIGGGCAGLSLAYELEIHEKLKDKTLAIIEPRDEYKRDKTWSFWKVTSHNFDDCVKKNWVNFSINIPEKTNYLQCKGSPYQSIDSGLFYEKINKKTFENYQNAGKIYVSNIEKIIETIFAIFDLINLSLTSINEDQIQHDHSLISEEINLNERI